MKTLGYYNGEIGEIEDMRVPMNDRVCWFGDGVYDASLAVNKRVLFLEEHINRFFSSAALLQMTPPLGREELGRLLAELALKVEGEAHFVYWQLTRGTAQRFHIFPEAGIKPNLWVFIRPAEFPDLESKVKVITVEDTRFFHCNIKTLNLIPNVMASERAKQAGADEVVFYRKNLPDDIPERVTEASHSNIHIIKDGVFRTAPADNLILPGIIRAHLIEQCVLLGIPVKEEPFSVTELMEADEALLSSSGSF
ncbi:MAG: aminotransferase class IV, partial [Treponema sp.]|nr:aminotransferase class IV [Treponema sp.]